MLIASGLMLRFILAWLLLILSLCGIIFWEQLVTTDEVRDENLQINSVASQKGNDTTPADPTQQQHPRLVIPEVLRLRKRTPSSVVDPCSSSNSRSCCGCHAGRLCVGPGQVYPMGHQNGLAVRGTFVVPPLPKSFNPSNSTYYDYLNIWFLDSRSHNDTLPGYYNQFVPQLMLGDVLAGSTNHPRYTPKFMTLDSWHIGSQYFFALCRKNSTMPNGYDCDNFIPKAATGRLIPVQPGEGVFTTFELLSKSMTAINHPARDAGNQTDLEWHLSMGVIGDPERVSRVKVPTPYMSLLPNKTTARWTESRYNDIYIGACLENYGMTRASNYPSYWRMDVVVDSSATQIQPIWSSWSLEQKQRDVCPWQPRSSVESYCDNGKQQISWEAYLQEDTRATVT